MTALFNRRRSFHQLLCASLAALMAAGPTTAWAQEPPTSNDAVPEDARPANTAIDNSLLADPAGAAKRRPFDLTYAVSNSFLLVAARPAQLLKSPVAELYPTEVIQAVGLKEFGIDPLTAEQIVGALAPTVGGPPSYSAVAHFSQPFELKSSEITEHTTPAEVDGREYLQSGDPMLPSLCALDDDSLLVAPDYFLRHLLTDDAPEKVSQLAAAFTAADQGDDLLAMVDVAPLRPLINMGLSQADIPAEFVSLKQVPNLVKFIELRVNLSRPAPSSLIITANDKAAADQLVETFEEMKQLLAERMTAEAQKQIASDDPVEQAAGRYFLRMSRLLDERLQLEREADQLILFRGDLTGQGSNPMVGVATVGMLVGLMLPAVQAAREAARRNASMNNMKQIMLGLLNHESAKGSFPAYANFDADGKPLLSWRVHILPYMEQMALYNKFHLDEPWDSEHNKQLISQMPEVYLDPSSGMAVAEGKTHYLGVKGDDYLFDGTERGRQLRTITDGTSNTIAVVQTGNTGVVPWTKPEDWEPDEKNLMKPFDPIHPGGFLAAFADGSIQFISESIDPRTFKALLTAAGGEVVNAGSY